MADTHAFGDSPCRARTDHRLICALITELSLSRCEPTLQAVQALGMDLLAVP